MSSQVQGIASSLFERTNERCAADFVTVTWSWSWSSRAPPVREEVFSGYAHNPLARRLSLGDCLSVFVPCRVRKRIYMPGTRSGMHGGAHRPRSRIWDLPRRRRPRNPSVAYVFTFLPPISISIDTAWGPSQLVSEPIIPPQAGVSASDALRSRLVVISPTAPRHDLPSS